MSPVEARALFAATPGVEVVDEPTAHRYPLATLMAGRDDVAVGRIRADASLPGRRGLAFWVVADNLRRGAASNAVDLARGVLDRGLLLERG
jgi:aspartate-semialdehyde dehydrogenase